MEVNPQSKVKKCNQYSSGKKNCVNSSLKVQVIFDQLCYLKWQKNENQIEKLKSKDFENFEFIS